MSVSDTISTIVVLIFVLVVMVATGIIWNEFNTALQGSDLPQAAKDITESASTQWPGAMDWIFASLAIGMPLIAMALASFIDTPPMFFYIVIGFLLLLAFIGWGLQTAFQDMLSTGSVFANYIIYNMPIANWVLEHMGIYTLFITLLISAGTYIKQRGGYGYGGAY